MSLHFLTSQRHTRAYCGCLVGQVHKRTCGPAAAVTEKSVIVRRRKAAQVQLLSAHLAKKGIVWP